MAKTDPGPAPDRAGRNRLPPWKEVYESGSAEGEQAAFRAMADAMRRMGPPAGDAPERTMFAKTVVGVGNATLTVDEDVPADLAVGHFQAGAVHPATLRFSNASAARQPDGAPDMRGLALRLNLGEGRAHDLLLVNFPTALARNGRQFFQIAAASAGDRREMLARLAARLGAQEGQRIAIGLRAGLRLCASLALEHFWSAGAGLWGTRPVRLELRPMSPGLTPAALPSRDPDGLRRDLAERLAVGAVRYRLAVQRYVDEQRTPIEDATVDWRAGGPPAVEIATLEIPRQDLFAPPAAAAQQAVEALRFDPWNAPPPFRPLGSLNRLRRWTYVGSDAGDETRR